MRYLENLPLAQVAACCSDETRNFLKGAVSDDRSCLELFRRAVVRRDEGAWVCLYQQYAPLVQSWVCQRQEGAPQLVDESATSLVNAAFAKFALAVTPDKMASFARIEAVLAYLKRCARSVVADALRAQQAHPPAEELTVEQHDRAGDDPAEGVVTRLAAQGLWQLIAQELHDEGERILLSCSLLLHMKPTEIADQYPHLFPSVGDVYRVKRNALERLRRNSRLRIAIGSATEEDPTTNQATPDGHNERKDQRRHASHL
jgi:DNA-directed RNA polymerase specialized sigma24 family protein